MKDESLDLGNGIRSAIVEHIYKHVDKRKIDAAINLQSRYARTDALCNVFRDAVLSCPFVMFSGVPHVYCPSVGYYNRFSWSDMEDSLYVVMRKLDIGDGNYGKVGYFVKVAMAAISNREYDIDVSIVVMKNGVYKPFDGKLYKFDERFMTNAHVDYEYNPEEVPVLWNRFLLQVLPNDEHRELLQEFLASCYVERSKVKMEQMLILLGSGQNGKSVIFEVVSSLLGEDNVAHFYISDLIGGNRREQNIANCKGKRLNYCSEIRTKEISMANADAIKTLISSEPVMGRKLFCEPEKIKSFPILMANANTLPKIEDPNDSLRRRFLIIPFVVTIPKEMQNLTLATELKESMSGIFNWIMEGYERIKNNGFKLNIPSDAKKIVDDYFSENSPILKWTSANGIFSRMNNVVDPNSMWKSSKDLYMMYKCWSEDEMEECVTFRRFVSDMRAFGYTYHRNSMGSGFIYFHGKTVEQIRAENLEIAIQMEKDKQDMNAASITEKNGTMFVTGVSNAEKYLGLPTDTVWPYLTAGKLNGCYKTGPDGPVFNIKALQYILADSGYFKMLKEKGVDGVKNVVKHKDKSFRRFFNRDMETRGLPFRKYKICKGVIPARSVGHIIVPDDWVYTYENARAAIEEYNNKHS